MSFDKSADPYEAAVRSLLAKKSRLMAEVEAIEKSLQAIEEARGAAAPSSGAVVAPASHAAPMVADKFRGLGLEPASAKVLSESDHLELTAKQIWTVLAAAGYSLLSERPEQSVSWALRKRETKVGDVILVGDGKWGMTDWYSQARLKELRETRNNASTRNHVEHVAKTKAGIANAKLTRLDHWGRRRVVTAEHMTKAYEVIRAGGSKLAAATAAGIKHPTFGWYWMVFEMENWKPGLPFPPARRAVELKKAPKKHEMWPLENSHANRNGTVGSTVPH